MYIPTHFKEQDFSQISAFIERFPLATMIWAGQQGLEAHHISLLL